MEYSVELEFQVYTDSLPYITPGVITILKVDGFAWCLAYCWSWQTPTGVLSTAIDTTIELSISYYHYLCMSFPRHGASVHEARPHAPNYYFVPRAKITPLF